MTTNKKTYKVYRDFKDLAPLKIHFKDLDPTIQEMSGMAGAAEFSLASGKEEVAALYANYIEALNKQGFINENINNLQIDISDIQEKIKIQNNIVKPKDENAIIAAKLELTRLTTLLNAKQKQISTYKIQLNTVNIQVAQYKKEYEAAQKSYQAAIDLENRLALEAKQAEENLLLQQQAHQAELDEKKRLLDLQIEQAKAQLDLEKRAAGETDEPEAEMPEPIEKKTVLQSVTKKQWIIAGGALIFVAAGIYGYKKGWFKGMLKK